MSLIRLTCRILMKRMSQQRHFDSSFILHPSSFLLCNDGAVNVGKNVLLQLVFVGDGDDGAVGDIDDERHIIHKNQRVFCAFARRFLRPRFAGASDVAASKAYLPGLQTGLRMGRKADFGRGRLRRQSLPRFKYFREIGRRTVLLHSPV